MWSLQKKLCLKDKNLNIYELKKTCFLDFSIYSLHFIWLYLSASSQNYLFSLEEKSKLLEAFFSLCFQKTQSFQSQTRDSFRFNRYESNFIVIGVTAFFHISLSAEAETTCVVTYFCIIFLRCCLNLNDASLFLIQVHTLHKVIGLKNEVK